MLNSQTALCFEAFVIHVPSTMYYTSEAVVPFLVLFQTGHKVAVLPRRKRRGHLQECGQGQKGCALSVRGGFLPR